MQGHLPRNESFGNLGNIGLFASRPPSRSRSRNGSIANLTSIGSFSGKGSGSISSKGALDEVSQKIRGAMRERGKERRRKSEEGIEGWEFTGSGAVTSGTITPASEEGKKDV